jgi:hypothetical protein
VHIRWCSRAFVLSVGLLAWTCGTALVLFTGARATAAPMPFVGSQGSLSAAACFDTSGTSLVVTLTNTSTSDVLQQQDVLTAVFFDVSGLLLNLQPASGSAVIAPGSTVLFGGTDPGGVVGGEFAYLEDVHQHVPNNANYGISSAGYGVFGGANFPGSNLEGPIGLNGVEYGITSPGDDPSTGQTAVTGADALIENSVVFTIPGLPAGFNPVTAVSDVFFQYGTKFNDAGYSYTNSYVPDPPGMGALSLCALAALRRRAGAVTPCAH